MVWTPLALAMGKVGYILTASCWRMPTSDVFSTFLAPAVCVGSPAQKALDQGSIGEGLQETDLSLEMERLAMD